MKSLGIVVASALALAVTPAQAQSQSRTVGEVFRDCEDCPEMVVISAGSFTMGSPASEEGRRVNEGPQRRITFAAGFAAGRFEVTRGQYGAFVRATGRNEGGNCRTDRDNNGSQLEDATGTWRDPGFAQGEDHPVVCVSWEDARAYVQWLNIMTSGGYRLLSDAEWEYAARAGTQSVYPWGDVASHEYENYGAEGCCGGFTSGRDQWVHTSPVGTFPPNGFGLSDMGGNVEEWMQDCFEISLDSVPDDGRANEAGRRDETGACLYRVTRGGSWISGSLRVRSANRYGYGEQGRLSNLGFRVARTLN